jgi:hypothetical protein
LPPFVAAELPERAHGLIFCEQRGLCGPRFSFAIAKYGPHPCVDSSAVQCGHDRAIARKFTMQEARFVRTAVCSSPLP